MADDDPEPAPLKFYHRTPPEEIDRLTDAQRCLIVGIRSLDPSLRGLPLKECIAEMIPPAKLFDRETQLLPNFNRELRDFLDRYGCDLAQHQSRAIANTLAHELYDESDDRDVAIELAKEFVALGRRRDGNKNHPPLVISQDPTPTNQQQHYGTESKERVAHNVAVRFKDKDAKFSGYLGQCWLEYVDSYNKMSRDYSLTEEQKKQYLHNLLSHDALRFYSHNVEPHAATFQIAVDMVSAQYNSAVRQGQVLDHLDNLSIDKYVSQGLEEHTALTKIYAEIVRMSPQCPSSHKGDAHRIRFIRRAVSSRMWSHPTLQRAVSAGLTFQQVYGELESALQLHSEGTRIGAGNIVKSETAPPESKTLYVGQGRYRTRRLQGIGKGHKRGRSLADEGCFNCGEKGHVARRCPKPYDLARATKRRMSMMNKSKEPLAEIAFGLLADICTQTAESASEGDNDEAPSSLPAEMFESALANLAQPPADTALPSEGVVSNDKEIGHVACIPPDIEQSHEEDLDVLACGRSDQFDGACVDSGAEATVIGRRQAEMYAYSFGVKISPQPSKRVYRFGRKRYPSAGIIAIKLPISDHHHVPITADIVDVDVPFLLGLDVLTNLKVLLDFGKDRLFSKVDNWSLPLTRKLGHLYVVWPVDVAYTKQELRRIHRHFKHVSADKLYNLIKRADPDAPHPRLMPMLDEVQRSCEVCMREADQPMRFRVSPPDANCIFNHNVSLDIMKLNGKPVLHAVDRGTRFSAARFLQRESTSSVWNTFSMMWANVYVGYPNTLSCDQGSVFTSAEWESLLRSEGINMQISGVESHNALGVGERYHAYLRKLFDKICSDDPALSDDVALSIAVKASNDTAGPSGIVPTLLVFGILPRLPILPKPLPDQMSRMKALRSARSEMARIIARTRVETALSHNVPSSADQGVKIGDEVLWYREKPIGKWLGPYAVVGKEGPLLRLDDGDRQTTASTDRVKIYRPRQPPDGRNHNTTQVNAGERDNIDRTGSGRDGIGQVPQLPRGLEDEVVRRGSDQAVPAVDAMRQLDIALGIDPDRAEGKREGSIWSSVEGSVDKSAL